MTKLVATVAAGVLIAGATMAADRHKDHGKMAAETKITPQTTCPVMGGKINKDLYVDHDGKRVYVCCKGCIGTVQKDPEKYIKKLADKGEVPASVPEATKHKKETDSGHEGHDH
jgi:hypothetical protein